MKRLSAALLGLSIVGLTALAPSAANANCQLGNCWGAVAYGPRGAWAYSYNFPTQQIAARVAQRNCGGRCNHVLTFANTCGAYASGPSAYSHYGWGTGNTQGAARALALQQCYARGPNCAVRVSACTLR
jgi:hypothetical protein